MNKGGDHLFTSKISLEMQKRLARPTLALTLPPGRRGDTDLAATRRRSGAALHSWSKETTGTRSASEVAMACWRSVSLSSTFIVSNQYHSIHNEEIYLLFPWLQRESGACFPGHTIELSTYRSTDTRESINLPYPVRVEKVSFCSCFYSVLSFISYGILPYQVACCVMASTMCLVIHIHPVDSPSSL